MLVAGVLIGSLLVGTSVALTSVSFTYSHTKTGYLNVSPMDFAPDSLRGATNDYFTSWGAFISNDDASRCFNTGVNLPQGAKMKKLTYFYQSDATSDFFGELVRMNPGANASTTFAAVTPADDTDVPTSVTATIPLASQSINNKRYAYSIGVCPFDGTVFMGVRIQYTYTTAGD
jgi:hypothetical protein